jgi:nucleoside triphosphate diphosphatase
VADEARELAAAGDTKAAFDELGDLLFAVVALARKLKVNPEDALRVAGQRFRKRFAELEAEVAKDGLDLRELDPGDLSKRWEKTG